MLLLSVSSLLYLSYNIEIFNHGKLIQHNFPGSYSAKSRVPSSFICDVNIYHFQKSGNRNFQEVIGDRFSRVSEVKS
jgi:hypothetical protein